MTTPYYDLLAIYDALRARLITWESVRTNQDQRYRACANGCGALGKWRTLDGRELCGPCYLAVADADLAELSD